MQTKRMSGWILGFLLCALPLSAKGHIVYYVSNQTPYYLHIQIEERQFLFVEPDAEVQLDNGEEVQVRVYYSPGQQVSGSATRRLQAEVTDNMDCECDDKRYKDVDGTSWAVQPGDLN